MLIFSIQKNALFKKTENMNYNTLFCCSKKTKTKYDNTFSLICIKDRSDLYAYLRQYVKQTYFSKRRNNFKDFLGSTDERKSDLNIVS